MKRVVIDTNVLLVCISSKSSLHRLFIALGLGEIELCLTNEIVMEYLEILSAHRGSKKAAEIMDLIFDAPCVTVKTVYYRWNLIQKDYDDNKFVDCAIAAGADYIITEDKHFDELKSIDFPIVNCIRAKDFIEQHLSNQES